MIEKDEIALHREIWELKQFLGSAVRNAGGELILDRKGEFSDPVLELEVTVREDWTIVIREVKRDEND